LKRRGRRRLMDLSIKQRTKLIALANDLTVKLVNTTSGLISYANESQHISDGEEYIYGHRVLKDLVDAAEAGARKALGLK
jgi:hypothetical protein